RQEMSYSPKMPLTGPGPPSPSILLRRLACPGLPPNPTPGGATLYNPYVTVDYMEDVKLWVGQVGATQQSEGSLQPHPADATQKKAQPQANVAKPTPTFFAANQPPTGAANYDWLVHLDRRLISSMELLHVSALPPHLLTQRFYARPVWTFSKTAVAKGTATK